jgi:hypothetical protein
MRRGYELNSLFFGRPIRPFHLAVMLATGTIAYTLLFRHTRETSGFCQCDATGHLLGYVAVASAVFLLVGWWFRKEWFAEWGLLLAVGVWVTRMVYVLINSESTGTFNSTWASAFLSAAWAIGAGGAYLLERYDHMMEEEESE